MRVCAEGAIGKGYTVASLSPFGVGISVPSIEALCSFCDVLVLPVPATRDGEHILGTDVSLSSLPLSPRHAVFGGFFPKERLAPAHAVFDCAEKEDFLLKNAALTAEGAIASALQATGRSFYGCSIAVIGYGRIARFLLRRLSGFTKSLTVYARRPEALADAALCSYATSRLCEDSVIREEIIFNTVPEKVFARVSLSHPLYVCDLGGGMPAALATEGGDSFGVTAARGVPGVFAPTAAGEVILESLCSFLLTL